MPAHSVLISPAQGLPACSATATELDSSSAANITSPDRIPTTLDPALRFRKGVERRRERWHVTMARVAVAQGLTGRKVATPELRFVDGAVFLGAPDGRANAAAVLILL